MPTIDLRGFKFMNVSSGEMGIRIIAAYTTPSSKRVALCNASGNVIWQQHESLGV